MSVKDSIIDVLREGNCKLPEDVRNRENKFCETEITENKLE